jgi:hypothetical protein
LLTLEQIYSNITLYDIELLNEGKITKSIMDFIKGVGIAMYNLFASPTLQTTLKEVHFNKSDLDKYKNKLNQKHGESFSQISKEITNIGNSLTKSYDKFLSVSKKYIESIGSSNMHKISEAENYFIKTLNKQLLVEGIFGSTKDIIVKAANGVSSLAKSVVQFNKDKFELFKEKYKGNTKKALLEYIIFVLGQMLGMILAAFSPFSIVKYAISQLLKTENAGSFVYGIITKLKPSIKDYDQEIIKDNESKKWYMYTYTLTGQSVKEAVLQSRTVLTDFYKNVIPKKFEGLAHALDVTSQALVSAMGIGPFVEIPLYIFSIYSLGNHIKDIYS